MNILFVFFLSCLLNSNISFCMIQEKTAQDFSCEAKEFWKNFFVALQNEVDQQELDNCAREAQEFWSALFEEPVEEKADEQINENKIESINKKNEKRDQIDTDKLNSLSTEKTNLLQQLAAIKTLKSYNEKPNLCECLIKEAQLLLVKAKRHRYLAQ